MTMFMCNNNEQNGRQPHLPQQTVPSTTVPTATAVIHKNIKSLASSDPRIRNANVTPTENHRKKCRDFVWGICKKGAQCKFRHELDVEATAVIHKNIKSLASSDPRIRNANVTPTENHSKKCRDFVWGICKKGAQCKFRHELDVESMKDILKFCHDHQNRTGCTRPECTYLHTSKEEENLFLTTGQIPRALAERYAAMSTAQMNLYVSECLVQAPPPPPPPSSAAPPLPLPAPLRALLAPPSLPPPEPTTTTAPVRMTSPTFSGQIPRALAERCAAMSTAQMNLYVSECLVQAPPPPPPPSSAAPPLPLPAPLHALLAPPPPPPPPPTTTTAPVRMTSPKSSAPSPVDTPTMFSGTQPPPLPPMFDASRPPPPIPTNATPNKNGALKRAAGPSEAGPSKARKTECSKVVEIETACENCIQPELRSELYHQELQKLECESDYQSYIYEKKSAENANGRLLLKSTVSPELFQILDKYMEESSQQMQVQDLLGQFNQTPSFDSETSTVPRQFLLQLMESVLNQRTLMEPTPVPSVGIDETSLLHSLTALTRRANPISHTTSDVTQAVLEVIRNCTTNVANTQSAAHTPTTAFHLPNGSHPLGAPRPPRSTYPTSGLHPANATHPLSVKAVAAPTAYLYQPAVPPPAVRGYYSQTYPSTSNHVPNIHQSYPNSPARIGVTPQVPTWPSTSAPAAPVQNYNAYAMGRYPPQPHNYPPFP